MKCEKDYQCALMVTPSASGPALNVRREAGLSSKSASGLLRTAAALVDGDRAKTHGDKIGNHENISRLWGAFLGITIRPQDVALMMVLLKVARTKSGTHNLDDYVDMAAYAGVAAEIVERP